MLIPYKSIKEPCQREKEIKKSIFIAEIFPVRSEKEGMEILESIRKKYKDASHHCWAMRTGTEQIQEKSGDDGEPQGTAGHPMLRIFQMKGMTNILAVVTRYFGGIKLGAGGLTRAYSSSLSETLAEAETVVYTPHLKMELKIPYPALGAFEHYMEGTDIRITERTFTELVQIKFLCLPENKEIHETRFNDMTGGKAELKEVGEGYIPIVEKV